MRRKYNNGTSLKDIAVGATKFTPAGGIGSVVKKVMDKNKKDKDSRNPNPKTPKMMGSDKKQKTVSTSSKRRNYETKRKEDLRNEKEKMDFFKKRRKQFGTPNTYRKPIGKMKLEVRKSRKK